MNVIFDLDGTLADCQHRIHLIEGPEQNHRAFFAACSLDLPIHDMIDMLHHMYLAGYYVYIVSGRSDECRQQTEEWLDRYGIPYKFLFMRKSGDHRPDYIVKRNIYTQEFYNKEIKVDYVFDDRDSVVAMWRSLGLRCLQVAPGAF